MKERQSWPVLGVAGRFYLGLAVGAVVLVVAAAWFAPQIFSIQASGGSVAKATFSRIPIREGSPYYITARPTPEARVYVATTDRYAVWTSPIRLKPARKPDPGGIVNGRQERPSDIASVWAGPVTIYGAPIEGSEHDLSRGAKMLAVLAPEESPKIYRTLGFLRTIDGHVYLRIDLTTDLRMYPAGYRLAIVDQGRLVWLPYAGGSSGGIFSGELYSTDWFLGYYFQPDAYSYYLYDFRSHRLAELHTTKYGKPVSVERAGPASWAIMFEDGTRVVIPEQ